MKILMTTDTVGGVWSYSLELIRALAPLGVEVSLATLGAASADQREEARALENLRLFESHYKLEWMEEPWEDVKHSGEWLMALERRIGPDLVHLNGYSHGQCPFSAPVMVVAHSCVLSWFEAVKGHPAPGHWDRYRLEVAAGLLGANRVVAPSRFMLDAIQRHYCGLRHTQVIYNGRDAAKYMPGKKEAFILSAGRLWDEAKNVGALDAVANRLPWPVVVAGETQFSGSDARPLHVRALGRLPQDELRPWFARAGVYCLPARYEPFGLSVLEAALSGCALVLGNIASLREIWGEAAVYVSPDDGDELAKVLSHLCSRPAERARLAAAAHERALDYTSRKMGDAYYSAYQKLIRGGSGETQEHALICESSSSITR
jgi:glycogen(starch) synthase